MDAWPIVALANWYRFLPGEQVRNPRVESRMLLWCVRGGGEVGRGRGF